MLPRPPVALRILPVGTAKAQDECEAAAVPGSAVTPPGFCLTSPEWLRHFSALPISALCSWSRATQSPPGLSGLSPPASLTPLTSYPGAETGTQHSRRSQPAPVDSLTPHRRGSQVNANCIFKGGAVERRRNHASRRRHLHAVMVLLLTPRCAKRRATERTFGTHFSMQKDEQEYFCHLPGGGRKSGDR